MPPPTWTVRRSAARAASLAGISLAAGVSRAAAQEPGGAPHDQEAVRRLADEILARAEFRRPPPSVFERVQAWLADRIGQLVESLVGGGANAISWLLFLALVAAVVWFVLRFARTVQADPARPRDVAVERSRTPGEWRAEAVEHEAAGEWKPALRCRYRALVGDLAARGIVPDVAGRTAGEYRTDVGRALPPVAPDFAGATELFERAWYGDRVTGPQENEQFRALEARVLEGAAR